MDLLAQYEIPYLHPLAVHFPLVLLLLAGAVGLAYAIRGTALWRRALLVFLALGAATAYWAGETGETLEDDVRGEPMVEAIVDTHEQGAEWTLWAALGALAVAVGVTVWVRRLPAPTEVAQQEPLALRLVLLVVALVPAGLVAWTAHLGGLMVWGVPG